MSRKTECDCCGETGVFNIGMRKVGKPVGWGWMQLAVKEKAQGTSTRTCYDLCPKCTKRVQEVLKPR